MIEATRPAPGQNLSLPLVALPRSATAAPPASAIEPDRLHRADPSQLQTDKQIKAYLGPAMALLARTGYGDAVAALRRARFKASDGKFLKVEYYAATSFSGAVSLGPEFFKLGSKGQAGVLLHESVHLRQSLAYRAAATINQGYGLAPFKRNFAEIDAYQVQWAACPKLGLAASGADSEIYWEARTVLEEAGLLKGLK